MENAEWKKFRWAASLIKYVFTFLILASFITRYVWNHTIIPILSRFHIPTIRKRTPISFQHGTVLITGGQSAYILLAIFSDLNPLKYNTRTTIREELPDNISVLVNCAATGHFKNILSHTDDEYQYTLIANTLAPILEGVGVSVAAENMLNPVIR
ncbi:unnamed protein product [Rotaria socialis]